MPEVERGYNRDHENLSQFNIGMFCNESTRIPLYYNRYNGSLNDPGSLPYILENARDMGIPTTLYGVQGKFPYIMTRGIMPAFAVRCQKISPGGKRN